MCNAEFAEEIVVVDQDDELNERARNEGKATSTDA